MPVGAKATQEVTECMHLQMFFNLSLLELETLRVARIHLTEEVITPWELESSSSFPEIVYDDVETIKGMNIVSTTTAKHR